MDPTKDNVDEQMAELREALRDIDLAPEELTIQNIGAVSGTYDSIFSVGTADTITLSGLGNYNNNTVLGTSAGLSWSAGSGYNMSGLPGANTGPYTITTSLPSNSAWLNPTNSGKINLNGDEADIVINGVSLMDLLKDRLNIMIPDPRLEADWDELKALGDQYRALENKLREQGEMWARLKSMPPPDPIY